MAQNALAVQQDAAIMPISQASVSLGTLQAASAGALVQGAREMANALADVIEQQRLSVGIQSRKYVKVEGWTTLGIMLGVVPREVSTVEEDGIYTATIELVRIVDQGVISRASAECGSADELDRYGKPMWANRPRYARRSMAQTRATGKACRLAFSWIMSLAGYEPTPAEEMPDEKPEHKQEVLLITDRQKAMLEARISELSLNRDGVKTWISRQFQVDHFDDLNRLQFNELFARLPRMAELKAKREAEQEAEAERKAIQGETRGNQEKAEQMLKAAGEIRQRAQYAEGKAYYREMDRAQAMENEARKMLSEST